MTHSGHNLQQILTEIEHSVRENKPVLAVFDLDSTLFDVSPRLTRILADFADVPEYQKKFPESVKLLKGLQTERSDWGIKQALIRAGLDSHHPDFHAAIKQFWVEHFFSNEYLDYDVPYEGAVDFVQKIFSLGCQIAYLTGRDVARMGVGSRAVLLKWNFPLDDDKAQLVLKPLKGMDDAEFKANWFTALPQNTYHKIWFFENEPVNVQLLRERHPEVEILFFSSTHSGKAPVPTDLPHIFHFLINESEKRRHN